MAPEIGRLWSRGNHEGLRLVRLSPSFYSGDAYAPLRVVEAKPTFNPRARYIPQRRSDRCSPTGLNVAGLRRSGQKGKKKKKKKNSWRPSPRSLE